MARDSGVLLYEIQLTLRRSEMPMAGRTACVSQYTSGMSSHAYQSKTPSVIQIMPRGQNQHISLMTRPRKMPNQAPAAVMVRPMPVTRTPEKKGGWRSGLGKLKKNEHSTVMPP